MRAALIAAALLLAPAQGVAGAVTGTWNPVDDARVGVYVLAWGGASAASGGVYAKGNVEVAHPTVTAKTPNLSAGKYYFAVKACKADKSECSAWSNEVAVTVLGPIPVPSNLNIRWE
jgi:hypothetical protein